MNEENPQDPMMNEPDDVPEVDQALEPDDLAPTSAANVIAAPTAESIAAAGDGGSEPESYSPIIDESEAPIEETEDAEIPPPESSPEPALNSPKAEALSKKVKKDKNQELERAQIDLRRIAESELEAVDTLFVPPKDYGHFDVESAQWEDGFAKTALLDSHHYLFLITGPDGSGKTFVAKHFAGLLLDRHGREDEVGTVYLYTGRGVSLLEIVNDPKLPSNAVIIIQDAFGERGIHQSEISDAMMNYYRESLQQRNTRFILTVTLVGIETDIDITNNLIVTTKGVDPNAIYCRYVDYYFPLQYGLKEQQDKLYARQDAVIHDIIVQDRLAGKAYFRPFRIKKYIEMMRDRPDLLEGDYKIDVLLQQVARTWFESLSLNHQLYAMLVVLCKDIDVITLEDLYERSVKELRDAGMDGVNQFIDPRRITTSALRSAIGLNLVGSVLQYENADYEAEVKTQIENYHRLLWSLTTWFRSYIENAPQDVDEQRRILERATAHIGMYHERNLREYLTEIAKNPKGYVAISAAYTLGFLAQQSMSQYDMVLKVLRTWAESHNPDLMWAAAMGVWRVHDALIRDVANRSIGLTDTMSGRDAARVRLTTNALEELWKLLHTLCDNYDQVSDDYKQAVRNDLANRLEEATRDDFDQLEEDELKTRREQLKHDLDVIFERLINAQENQNQVAILNTIANIGRSAPENAVQLLQTWLREDPDNRLWKMGKKALVKVFERSQYVEAPLLEQRCIPLLKLLPTALSAARQMREVAGASGLEDFLKLMLFGIHQLAIGDQLHQELAHEGMADPLEAVLNALLAWYEIAINKRDKTPPPQLEVADSDEYDDEPFMDQPTSNNATDASSSDTESLAVSLGSLWEAKVYPELLRLVNYADQVERRLLRNELAQLWIDSQHTLIRKIAFMLIARSHIMDGAVMDLPGNQRFGVIVLDATHAARQKRQYLEAAFMLVQRMSALAPMRVHHLGQAQPPRLGGQVNGSLITSNDVRQYIDRPPLLMPVIEFDPQVLREADRCYFVVVLNVSPIIDIVDLLETATLSTSDEPDKPLSPMEMAMRNRNKQKQAQISEAVSDEAGSWLWKDRLFFAMHGAEIFPAFEGPQPPEITNQITRINQALSQVTTIIPDPKKGFTPDLIALIEERLREQIALRLRKLDPDTWWQNLQAYDEVMSALGSLWQTDEAGLLARLDQWVMELNEPEKAQHPKDVTLTICWCLLATAQRSPEGLERVIAQVIAWLERDERLIPDDISEADYKDQVKLFQQMGSAATRLLFNFYGTRGMRVDVHQHAVLLRLLPPLLKLRRGYNEYSMILEVLFGWAEDGEWCNRLLDPIENELLTALQLVKRKSDIDWLADEIELYQNLGNYVSVFLSLKVSYNEFVALLQRLIQWRSKEDDRLRQLNTLNYAAAKRKDVAKLERPLPLPQGITVDIKDSLLPFLSLPEDYISWILKQIQRRQWELFKQNEKPTIRLDQFKNQAAVLASLSQLVEKKREGKLPKLEPGDSYGLIFVDVSLAGRPDIPSSLKDLLPRTAVFFMRRFQQTMYSSKKEQISLVMHRLGRQGVTAATHRGNPRKVRLKDLKPHSRIPTRYTPLIGPALERYKRPEQVSFVLILTASPVIDFQDWVDHPNWKGKFWVHSIPMPTGLFSTEAWHETGMRRIRLAADDKQANPQPIIDELIQFAAQKG